MDALADGVKFSDEAIGQLHSGFTAGNNHYFSRKSADGIDDFLFGHLSEGGKISVAEGACTVAAAQAHEYRRATRKVAFALKGLENFVDSHQSVR